MMTTTTTAIEQQSLNQDFTSRLTDSRFFEVLNDIEIELEGILVKEFEQGLPADIVVGF